MCGIVGYFSWKGRPLEPGRIQAMTLSLQHRGPDDSDVFEFGGVSLGHARLSIIDLSPAGRQPMGNEDGAIQLVYNGEIYNFDALRRELIQKGHTFRSDTDSEVIVHLYEEEGDACVERFNGMFAFALWDSRKNRLLLARDRTGQKPLFYYQDEDFIVFGSEVKALLASGLIEPELDYQALQVCLIYNAMAAPMTIFKGVRQLMPARIMACANTGCAVFRYWDLFERLAARGPERLSEAEWLEGFAAHFDRSVAMRMRSDAPYGAFLSGGLDSSAVVKVMAQVKSDPVLTFAFGFKEAPFDETSFAGAVAEQFGTRHRNITAREEELPSLVERVIHHGEEYTPNPCFIPVYLLCRGASEHVKMILSGDGGDELLAGYETYQATYAARVAGILPSGVTRVAQRLADMLPRSDDKVPLEDKIKRFARGAEARAPYCHVLWRHIFMPTETLDVLTPGLAVELAENDPTALYRQALQEGVPLSYLGRLLYADFAYYMPNDALVKMDRMGMAHGLEIRNPFLDFELVEHAFAMPDSLKLRRMRTKKYALKHYLKGALPHEFIHRKKAGFNVPVDAWLRGPLQEFVRDELSESRVRKAGVFRPDKVTALMEAHMSRKDNTGLRLWNILCFHIFLDMFFYKSRRVQLHP